MMTVAEYRAAMLARRAAKAAVSVAELLARSEADALRTQHVTERRLNRRSGWPAIACKAAAHGRSWTVCRFIVHTC